MFEDNPDKPVSGFFKSYYQHLNIDYPKFFKMDALCKLGFLAAETILQHESVKNHFSNDSLALIFSNSASSLDTDIKFQETIKNPENYFPSPALFVYTLPNIVIGEIAIRHQLTGESIFFIDEHFDPETLYTHALWLFQQNLAQTMLCGRIELLEEQYEAVLFFVKPQTQNNENCIFETENMTKIYNLYINKNI